MKPQIGIKELILPYRLSKLWMTLPPDVKKVVYIDCLIEVTDIVGFMMLEVKSCIKNNIEELNESK